MVRVSFDKRLHGASRRGDFALLCQRADVNPKLVVIGAGYMGGALVKGLMSKGEYLDELSLSFKASSPPRTSP